ncbi:hypothetical protein LXL04_011715 [Taraxacum kok-saghyz]
MIMNVLEGPEVGFFKGITLRSFENSYIPENPRTPKPLTFSKNRLRGGGGAKNRSNISPVAKKNSEKNDFFFQKLCICAKKKFAYVHSFFLSLYNTHLKGFVKKNLKKNAKKKLHICTKIKKKSCTYAKVKKISFFRNFFSANCNHYERFGGSRSRFFERNNGLGDIGNWGRRGSNITLKECVTVIGRDEQLPYPPNQTQSRIIHNIKGRINGRSKIEFKTSEIDSENGEYERNTCIYLLEECMAMTKKDIIGWIGHDEDEADGRAR